jgi:PAS domain S-box-containing protein
MDDRQIPGMRTDRPALDPLDPGPGRQAVEVALRESEARFRTLVENTCDLICEVDQDARFVYLSPNYATVLGYEPAELLGRHILERIHADDHPLVAAELAKPASQVVFRYRHKNGAWRWFESTGKTYATAAGRCRGVIVSRDISERTRSQEALRASEVKYRSLIENLEQCVFLKDVDLRYVAANRPFCQSLGRPEADVLGRTDYEFYPRALAERHRADDQRVLGEGKRLEREEQGLLGGRLCTVRVVKTPVRDAQGRAVGVLGIAWDVTEQRALEAQLRQAQKMEAIGQLAGGVAHDFNNLLTAILGNLSLVNARLPEADPGRELVAAAEGAAQRAATLTSQLLGFSRQTLLRPQSLDLHATIDEVVGLLRRAIDPRITLEVQKAARPWTVRADPGQMTQVLMNLCLNARDAMPDGGRLQLETENVVLDAGAVRLHLEARPGEFVRLRVSDTGHGIAPETRAHLFEPFFTTKGPGKGTGLGLAMVFGIVKQHRGWIEFASEVNQGTRFDIYLPREALTIPAATAPANPEKACRGTETVLLVDDEPMIRNLGRTILQQYGYRVLLAEDGQGAVELYPRHPERIDLVILDLTMPRLSGSDTFQRLLEIDPQVRVLFASGYSAEHAPVLEHDRIVGFIGKPYRPADLARMVRAALDRK